MNINPDTSLALMQAAQGDTQNAINATKNAKPDKQLEHFEEVAKDFEAMFMTEMLKPMFEQIKPDERFGGGKGEEIFNGFMLQEYGKLIAERGEIGIADAVKEELIRMQGEEVTAEDIYNAKKQVRAGNTETNITLDAIIKEQINAN